MAEDKKEEDKEEKKEEEKYTRSIQVQGMCIGIEITSEDKKDTLDEMRKLAEYFLDKYK